MAGEAMMASKDQMLSRLQQEFERWDSMLAGMSEAEITETLRASGWSIKDVIAHLWAWQQLSIARMQAAVKGGAPDFHLWSAEFNPDHDQKYINAWIHETYRDKPWSAVYGDWKAGFQHFLELGESVPEADLLEKGRYKWLPDYPLFAVLQGSYDHHAEHMEWLVDWLQQQSGLMAGGR
jgi:hypothetical protein